ncbi:MAG: hypothetical protein ACRDWE_07465 [Acidimicrobiales bacterium]
MAEFAFVHKQSVTTLVGTAAATILPAAPPQQSYELDQVVAVAFDAATVTGRLMQFATVQGYSQYGTVLGTVVEPFQAAPGESFIDGNGDSPVAYVSPGNLLYAVADSGSVLVKVVYRPIYRRG